MLLTSLEKLTNEYAFMRTAKKNIVSQTDRLQKELHDIEQLIEDMPKYAEKLRRVDEQIKIKQHQRKQKFNLEEYLSTQDIQYINKILNATRLDYETVDELIIKGTSRVKNGEVNIIDHPWTRKTTFEKITGVIGYALAGYWIELISLSTIMMSVALMANQDSIIYKYCNAVSTIKTDKDIITFIGMTATIGATTGVAYITMKQNKFKNPYLKKAERITEKYNQIKLYKEKLDNYAEKNKSEPQ